MPLSSAYSGTLVFSSEVEKTVTFSTPMSGTEYRVHLSPMVLAPLRVTNKTLTGFKVQAGAVVSGNVGYDVFD